MANHLPGGAPSTGSEPGPVPPALTPSGTPGPESACEPFRELIRAKLEQGLTAQRIHQDLVAEHGVTAKYHSVRRFVARLVGRTELAVRRLEPLELHGFHTHVRSAVAASPAS